MNQFGKSVLIDFARGTKLHYYNVCGPTQQPHLKCFDDEETFLEITADEFSDDPQAQMVRFAQCLLENVPMAQHDTEDNVVEIDLDNGLLTACLDGSSISIYEENELEKKPTVWEPSDFFGPDALMEFAAVMLCISANHAEHSNWAELKKAIEA